MNMAEGFRLILAQNPYVYKHYTPIKKLIKEFVSYAKIGFLILIMVICVYGAIKFIVFNTEEVYASAYNFVYKGTLQMQYPELPSGSEATSLAMALTYLGVPTDKLEAYEALPKSDFALTNSGIRIGPCPEDTYAGDARTLKGYYCFATSVTKAANDILCNSTKTAKDITGSGLETINDYLKNGIPVIAWVTNDYEPVRYSENFVWYIEKQSLQYRPLANVHCVLVCDFKDGTYVINDPLKGRTEISKGQFEESYIQMGKRAVIIE